jgi:membrane associated rhomboid family serine protease
LPEEKPRLTHKCSLSQLAINVVALILLARLVEPVYGSKEFLKFLFVVNVSTGLFVFLGVYVTFAFTQSGKLLYTEFYGFHGIAAGLLVAVKQIMGDQDAKLFGVLKINIKVQDAAGVQHKQPTRIGLYSACRRGDTVIMPSMHAHL